MASAKMFNIPSFKGLHECSDGDTQIKMGEAARMDNFAVTHDGNLKLRPGLMRYRDLPEGSRLIAHYMGPIIDEVPYLVLFLEVPEPDEDCGAPITNKAVFIRQKDGTDILSYQEVKFTKYCPSSVPSMNPIPCNFAEGPGLLCLVNMTYPAHLSFINYTDFSFGVDVATPYEPIVITGASPSGGGTELENINLLTPERRIQYSSDGKALEYVLPEEAHQVRYVYIDNEKQDHSAWAFDEKTHKVTFTTAPPKGVNNVEVHYRGGDGGTIGSVMAPARPVISQPFHAFYNGATDSRVFVYGNGNKCFYSGVTAAGEATPLYFPAMNEIEVGMDSGDITSMARHYGKLMAYKANGAYSITYEPVTLEDGRVIAGFYLRTQHASIGNQAPGQATIVENAPRTVCNGRVYDWRVSASYYRDERYARDVSQRVHRTMAAADLSKVVCFDDDEDQTWYCFLNDEAGTVVVHRYSLDVWFLYTSAHFRGVRFACRFDGRVVVYSGSGLLYMDEGVVEDMGEDQIPALWESGFMDFGSTYMRKSSSYIWVTMHPESASRMTVTAQTDKKGVYTEKYVGSNVLYWDRLDFRNFSFNMFPSPRPRRLKLKVKKFVFYKLIFRVDSPGARATVLGVDQQVQYSSFTK